MLRVCPAAVRCLPDHRCSCAIQLDLDDALDRLSGRSRVAAAVSNLFELKAKSGLSSLTLFAVEHSAIENIV